MKYLMTLTYNGKSFNGFQKQKNTENTIQSIVENTIKIITKEEVNITASGRTDAGVSAYFQPVHFEIEQALNTFKFIKSMNGILPNDIRVLNVYESNIHARFDAIQKTYIYKMYISEIDHPLISDALKLNPNTNIKLMKKFAKLLVGTHDFLGFRASGGVNETTIRTIHSAKLKQNKNFLTFEITGNGFLYKMVRNIVGTMIKIGEGKLNLEDIKPTLFTTFKATNTAKPEFLYLYNVKY